jgi:hypothetical protein
MAIRGFRKRVDPGVIMGARPKNQLTCAGLIVWCCLLFPATADARPKVDKLTLDNGDRVTCEIKELRRGILSIKTSYTKGIISIEWDHVSEITSTQLFEIELEQGEKYWGAIAAAAETANILVMSGLTTEALDLHEVVRISQLDENFWDRLDGSVDLGGTVKKANEERTYNLAATVKYRAREYRIESSLNSFLSDRSDTQATQRSEFNVGFYRKLRKKWFWTAATRLENNQELNLDLRSTLLAGCGRFIIQSNRTLLSWTAGLAGNREWYVGADVPQDNLEATLSLNYQFFVFGTRETDISIGLNVLPNITSWGRVRSNLNASFKHELVSDLYFRVGLLADYDSDPPTDGEGTDWNLTTSLGYSF